MRQHEGEMPAVAERADETPAAIEEREARVLGYRMRYLTGGAGSPVLLLHGLADCKESWQRVLPALARRHRVYAPDMLGCGASEKPGINYSLWAMAAYMRHFLDAVGVEAADIVGHSLGGGLALHLYIQYPERVRRLALVASGGLGRQLPLSLRLCTLAGSSPVIGALLASRHTQHPAARLGHTVLGRLWPATALADMVTTFEGAPLLAADVALAAAEEADILERLREPAARAAFLRMLRDVGNFRGQRTTALDVLDT
ncbi:MAG: alpha/beta fold hydrolase, partial [Ktedonobacterales bacterium]